MNAHEEGLAKGLKEILTDDVLEDMVSKAVASAIDAQVREYIKDLMEYSTFRTMVGNRVKEILAEEK